MKLEDVISYIAQTSDYIVNLRCDKCSTIVMSRKGDKFWHTPYEHSCWDAVDELKVEDERRLGGTIGLLITIGGEDENYSS
jgi:hypothetical protein